MDEGAEYVYRERLRLIEEREASKVRSVQAMAEIEREQALQDFIQVQEKELKAMGKKPCGKMKAALTPFVQINTQQTNVTTAPTYNQNGNGGQYVADNLYN